MKLMCICVKLRYWDKWEVDLAFSPFSPEYTSTLYFINIHVGVILMVLNSFQLYRSGPFY